MHVYIPCFPSHQCSPLPSSTQTPHGFHTDPKLLGGRGKQRRSSLVWSVKSYTNVPSESKDKNQESILELSKSAYTNSHDCVVYGQEH